MGSLVLTPKVDPRVLFGPAVLFPVPRYKLILAYDGTDFSGWQKQEPPIGVDGLVHPSTDPTLVAREGRSALRTVQAVVERAARMVVREPVIVTGASRTDAGVHARGQVASFLCSDGSGADNRGQGWPIERGADKLLRVLNARLPDDVRVVSVEPVADSFNPISDCTSKAYSYTLNVERERSLWDRRYVLHLKREIERGAVARMHEAAQRLVGEHDFNAFAAAGHGRLSTVRTIFTCAVSEPTPGRVRIDVSGNGFLYNMVRIVGGTLVEVGKGRMTAEDVTAALESRDRTRAGPTLPPEGLCLEWVKYDVQDLSRLERANVDTME